jgi:poly-gamma-glutamate synthesis protein (capsule biosynthesis protein)
MFGFEPDPAYPLAPFHPEAVNAMIGELHWHEDGRLEFGIVPVHVEPPGRPVLAEGVRAAEIRAYIKRITRDAGLPALEMT